MLKSGSSFALLAAVLFGASTPAAKLLLDHCGPVMLAGLLYLGSGIGLAAFRLASRDRRETREAPLSRRDAPWLAAAIACGGIAAPVLLLLGLGGIAASTGALLLNLEGVFTALLAWFIFRENFDRRIFAGMAAITLGAAVLAWPAPGVEVAWPALLIAGACAAWALDNNLTRKVSAADPVQITFVKGLVAGGVNLALALLIGEKLPGVSVILLALALGLLSYGISLTCFVQALRHIGTARTGAYFSTAPFVGAAISLVVFRQQPSLSFWLAGALMAFGVWMHLSEHHEHTHTHEELAHEHEHVHDAHHQHAHGAGVSPGETHTHWHVHARLRHRHEHFPDIHHRHGH
ncbi:MAG: DMT family transporter [Terrimicrobiaceae bacterium]|nr:DMT family transporter [Terrimicrobiaceae bacterium]